MLGRLGEDVVKQWHEGDAVEGLRGIGGSWSFPSRHDVMDGGGYVDDGGDHVLYDGVFGDSGTGDDEWYPEIVFIGLALPLPQSVMREVIAVVGRIDDDCLVQDAVDAQCLLDLPNVFARKEAMEKDVESLTDRCVYTYTRLCIRAFFLLLLL